MQSQGQTVSELAQQQSTSTVAARILARSRGLPVPFAAQRPVQNSTGKGWTMLHDHDYSTSGNMLVCVGTPVVGSLGACILVCRYLLK
mmetsp:Transcript_23464/g.47512  ORF Transcript_23464/g.47512 Transcript_23464/m.47512 type:complete len:88 (+) Transcript_23464:97-360(+)